MSWYNRVVANLGELPAAINYYSNEIDRAAKETRLLGRIETACQEISGNMAERYGQLQEVEAILKYLNIQYDKTRSRHYKKYLETYKNFKLQKYLEIYIYLEIYKIS